MAESPSQSQPQTDPVAVISALLDAEKVTPDTAESQPSQGEDSPAPNAQPEGADAPEAEKPAVAEIPLDQLEAIEMEVEVQAESGKETRKLPIKELKLGYMRQQDYQRKTAEIARQREEVGQKLRQGIESERTQYQENLKQLQAALVEMVAPELKNVDLNALAATDPFEWAKHFQRQQQLTGLFNSIQQKAQEAKAKADADALEAKKEKAQKTWAKLTEDIPGWNQELYQNVIKAGESLGLQASEIGAWLDEGQIKLLHRAYEYNQLKAGKPPAEKKVVAAPKAIAPGAKPAQSDAARVNAKEQLRKTGKVNDLARFLSL